MDQLYHNSKEEIPQFLRELKNKDTGYRLPTDYFAKMQAKVLDQVIEKEVVHNTVFFDNLKNWYKLFLRPQYAFVGIATIILIGIFIGTGNNSTGVNDSFSTLDDNDLEYFMENEIGDLNSQELMATLSTDEIDFNNVPISSNDALNAIPDDYIEELDDTNLIDFELED